jgi:Icc-related predicted phosphoesterase
MYSRGDIQTLVMAHEFLHYIYLAIRYVSSDYLVNLLIYTGDLAGRSFLEELYIVSPEKVFDSPRFVRKVHRVEEILEKSKIGNLIKRRWIDRGLPTKSIFSDEFRIKISMNMWSNMYFPDEVLRKARVLLGEGKRGL